MRDFVLSNSDNTLKVTLKSDAIHDFGKIFIDQIEGNDFVAKQAAGITYEALDYVTVEDLAAFAATKNLKLTSYVHSKDTTTVLKAITTTFAISTGTSLTAGTHDVAYTKTLAAAGGSGSYTWSVHTGSTLPAGLTLAAATGVISGTPTSANTYAFSIDCTDTYGQTITKAFTLVIA